jgi:hypothetical protein
MRVAQRLSAKKARTRHELISSAAIISALVLPALGFSPAASAQVSDQFVSQSFDDAAYQNPDKSADESNERWLFDRDRWNVGLTVTPELRVYTHNPQFSNPQNDQDDSTLQPSIAFEPHFGWSSPDGDDAFVFRAFGRYDPEDSERSHGDVREAYILHEGDSWDFVFGVNQVFWGVAESRNIVDVINQRDLVEDSQGDEKLGQPMVNLNVFGKWGEVSLFALPYFRTRTHPDENGRLRGPLPIDDKRTSIAGRHDEWRVDFAARYENNIGPVDVGLSHFYGVSRDPVSRVAFNTTVPGLEATVDGLLATRAGQMTLIGLCTPVCAPFLDGQFVIAQRYDKINQSSIDLLGAFGNWLFKFEGTAIIGHADDLVVAAVAGAEYTFSDLFGSGSELGLLGELAFDDRDQGRAPQIIHDNDVFAGARFDLNDVDNLQIRSGALVDVKNLETAITFEASRRLYKNLTGAIEGRFFVETDNQDILDTIADDDYLTFKLSYYF